MKATPASPVPVIAPQDLERLACRLGPVEEPGFGCLATERGHLPLSAMDVQARITGLFARTTVVQSFVNVHPTPLEATYLFPLPDRAAVSRFTLEVAGRVIEGVLKERGAARQEYAQAIQDGHRAAIAEEDRPGVFTMRAGNIAPRETVRVTLELTGPLPYCDGEATYRFPLVVAPRYIPGAPLDGPSVGDGVAPDTDQVPDASRITPPTLLPGFQSPVRLSLAVEVDPAGLQLAGLSSSIHAVSVSKGRVRTVTVQPGERLDRDFILRLAYAAEGVTTGLVTHRPLGAEGSFALTIVPPAATRGLPRDVVIVVDRSGSMRGWKMVCARRAAARILDALTPDDRFAFLAFDDRIDWPAGLEQRLTEATDRNRFRAVEFVSGLEARGGTEMHAPLQLAADLLGRRQKGRERVVVLVTDGQVGNEDQLVRTVRDRARGARVFAVGVDSAVNAAFLRRLAEPSGGLCELVESEERLDRALTTMHRRLGRPALTDLKLQATGLRLVPGSLAPDPTPDVFEGVPVVVMGRFTGAADGTITVKGTLADGSAFTEKIQAEPADSPAVSLAWARGRLRDLEDRYVVAHDEALATAITKLSLEQGVLCRFTAFVAVDRSARVAGPLTRVVQPVELPQGWQAPHTAMPSAPGSSQPELLGCLESLSFSADLCKSVASEPRMLRMSRAAAPCPPAAPRSRTSGERKARPLAKGGSFEVLDAVVDYLVGDGPTDALAPYRPELEQLKEALERVRTATDQDDLHDELGYLVGDLALLLDRLRREHGPAAFVERLAQVLERFTRLGDAERRPGSTALQEALARATEALGGTAGAPATDGKGRRREFWK